MQEVLSSISSPIVILAIIVVLLLLIVIPILLRRRRSSTEAEMPDASSSIDYTSLPVDEPTTWRDRFANLSLAGKILLVVVPLLVIVSAAVLLIILSPDAPVAAPPPTEPPAEIRITQADVVNPQTIGIAATTTLRSGTQVRAELLDGDQVFAWYNPDDATVEVVGGQINVSLRRLDDAPPASQEATYTVRLATLDGQVAATSPLLVPSIYRDAFYAQPVAVQSTPAPPPTATATAAAAEVSPTPEPTPTPAPVAGSPATVAGNGGNVRRQPLIRDDNRVALVSGGDAVQVLARTPNGEWYRIRTSAGEEGWISTTLITLDAATAAQVPIASVVTVFVAGEVRAQPSPGSNALGQVNRGETVELLQKTAAADWYEVRTVGDVVGWAPAELLGIPPEVAAQVPVQGAATPTPATGAAAPTPTTVATATPGATPATTGLTSPVRNGGRVRSEPTTTTDNVVGMINAGEMVELLAKNADGSWYRIRDMRGVEGWTSASLLSVAPEVATRVPVAP